MPRGWGRLGAVPAPCRAPEPPEMLRRQGGGSAGCGGDAVCVEARGGRSEASSRIPVVMVNFHPAPVKMWRFPKACRLGIAKSTPSPPTLPVWMLNFSCGNEAGER